MWYSNSNYGYNIGFQWFPWNTRWNGLIVCNNMYEYIYNISLHVLYAINHVDFLSANYQVFHKYVWLMLATNGLGRWFQNKLWNMSNSTSANRDLYSILRDLRSVYQQFCMLILKPSMASFRAETEKLLVQEFRAQHVQRASLVFLTRDGSQMDFPLKKGLRESMAFFHALAPRICRL